MLTPLRQTFDLYANADPAGAMVLDLEFFPAFPQQAQLSAGRATLPVAKEPFAVCAPLAVEGFGHVYVYADNAGRGYEAREVAGKTLDFVREAAASRIAAVRRAGGARELAEAESLLADGRTMPALAAAMHAGERFVVEQARQRRRHRPGFRFGCNAFGYRQHGAPYAERFGTLLDFATLPFYRGYTEKVEGRRDFAGPEKILEWTGAAGIPTKGHPLVWENKGGLPEWLRGRSYEQIGTAHRDYIGDAVGWFRDRVHIWDVINEAHDWANDPRHSLEQMVELTRLACDATREADPRAVRVVNSCCTWSEYAAWSTCSAGALGRPARNVLQYLRDVLAAGVDFEVIGIQMYYPYRDLFEISRHLDLFCALGKPVHITELGVSSSESPAKNEDIKQPIKRWHGRPWSETEQADWVEGYYTLCYAKPAIEAISWWDFSEPAWYPHGALVDEKLQPKESYRRLAKLIGEWRQL